MWVFFREKKKKDVTVILTKTKKKRTMNSTAKSPGAQASQRNEMSVP